MPNLTNGFFGQIAMSVDAYFRQARYSTLICFTAKSYENELESLASLLGKNVDGIIFAPSRCGGRLLRRPFPSCARSRWSSSTTAARAWTPGTSCTTTASA